MLDCRCVFDLNSDPVKELITRKELLLVSDLNGRLYLLFHCNTFLIKKFYCILKKYLIFDHIKK